MTLFAALSLQTPPHRPSHASHPQVSPPMAQPCSLLPLLPTNPQLLPSILVSRVLDVSKLRQEFLEATPRAQQVSIKANGAEAAAVPLC